MREEILLISALGLLILLILGALRYRTERREFVRRLAAERQARELAHQDVLTGLPDRHQFDAALADAISSPTGAGVSHGVFLVSLNGISEENLLTASQRLRTTLRDVYTVTRFGGSEFAVLTPHLPGAEAALNVAGRIMDCLAHPVSAVGIAMIPEDSNDAQDVLGKAEAALSQAKAERGVGIRFYEPAMNLYIQERSELETGLRNAMAAGRIETAFQSIVNIRTGKTIGFEASPRWIEPSRGPIDLQRMLAIAERAGLLRALTEHVLRNGCEAASDWPGYAKLSIDLVAGQLSDSELPHRIMAILSEYGLSAERLEVGIPESAVVADMEHAKMLCSELKHGGIRVVLKNFGTGNASLFHLRTLKLHKLKLDRSFIVSMPADRNSAAVMDAVVGLGHGLGLTIAVDGIEAPDQEATVVRVGCDEAQGTYYGGLLSGAQTQHLFADLVPIAAVVTTR